MPPHSLAKLLADSLADGGWRAKARPSQLPPSGDWDGWAFIGGRGTGKSRAGAEWVREMVEAGEAGRFALVGPTAGDIRDVMVEGESGILATASPWCRPTFEPSKRRLTWPNGAQASLYSSEEPDRLRGPQHDAAWCDELCAWNEPQSTWDMMQFGLRLGRRPRWLVTTTPKPIKLLRDLLCLEGHGVVITRDSTLANAANLPPAFIAAVTKRYGGTRLGRQELNAELLEDTPGALWSRAMLEGASFEGTTPEMVRIVVAVDPSGTSGVDDGDSVGIVICGKGIDGFFYVLGDWTCKLSPAGWGRRAVDAYREFSADRVIAERNFGGAMVEHVIRTVDTSVSFREVTAARGKIARAEPIAALDEQGKVRHTGSFPELEDQMSAMTSSGFASAGSPDRVDALVWALTELSTNFVVIDDSIGFSSVPAPVRLPDREYYSFGTADVLSITFPG